MAREEVVLTTCPRDCYDGCGIAVVKRNGVVEKVLGDRSHPVSRGALCGKCALAYNGVWRDRAHRLSTPLRRRGKKGEGRFAPIGWDDALDEIASRLRRTIDTHGPRSILHTHYTGTCSLLAGDFPMRFFNRLGATEVDPDTICNNAGHVALRYLYGSSVTGFDPKTARDSRCILVWGANPSASAPHTHKHWLAEAPGKVVVVDPVRHETAEAADFHLAPFPGTDAALAFAFMHIARRDGRLDEAFLAAHTLGWDELEPLVDGCTPGWASRATGVSPELIEEVGSLYARGPSLLWLGQGLQRQPRGGNLMRACGVLPAVTGNLGKPGAGLYYLNGSGPRNIDGDYVSAPHLRSESPSSVSHMQLVEVLADPARSQALVSWNMNVAASGPRQKPLRAALRREDLFTVVVDLFQTDTADYADIVLPAASFLEFDDLVTPYFHLYVSAQVKAEDPPGSALPNQEIFRRLARAMQFAEAELYESDQSVIDTVLERSGLAIDFAGLKRIGTFDAWADPVLQFANHVYPTPSGRVEIASAAAEADGLPRVPQPFVDARPAPGRLRLLSPAGKWQMNDSYGNDENIRRTLGESTVYLHEADVQALDLRDGETVELCNPTGSLAFRVAVSSAVPPGVALTHKGRWPKLEAAGHNVNVLNPGVPTDMGESSSVHGTEVELRKG